MALCSWASRKSLKAGTWADNRPLANTPRCPTGAFSLYGWRSDTPVGECITVASYEKNNRRTNQSNQNKPSRSKYGPRFPSTEEWTFTDFLKANGISVNHQSKEFGKGPNCTMLTLRKWMARDAALKDKSLIVRLGGVYALRRS